MTDLDESQVAEVVRRVLERVLPSIQSATSIEEPERTLPRPCPAPMVMIPATRAGVYEDVDTAVTAAKAAFSRYEAAPLALRFQIIEAIRIRARAEIETLSRRAVEETGLGRYDHKIQKNRLVIDRTPGPEILQPEAWSGDHGLTLTERAPYGVIGAITPTTNPTETIICNGIGMLAGGNAVVFNVHPAARHVSNFLVGALNEAIIAAGGPAGLIASVADPTIESAQALMKHPGVRLMVVTGGGGVVRAAMTSGKRTIAAGPGNPPVVVDETADLERAGRGIVEGGSLDNCIVCTAEKEVIVVEQIADRLRKNIEERGGYFVSDRERSRLEDLVLMGDGRSARKDWIGKDASKILEAIGGRSAHPVEILLVEGDEQSPFVQAELLMPVLGFVRVRSVDDAIAMAKRVEHGFGHTAAMYSTRVDRLHAMARAIDTSIFTKNAPTFAGIGLGGEGYTSFTIASPTGEGLTNARHFTRERRCTLVDAFRIV